MSVFIAIAAVLTLLALAWVVRPLLRPKAQSGVTAERLNASIYKDQLEALERDLQRGAITPADGEATRDELKLRLLDDTEDAAPVIQPSAATRWSARLTAVIIALMFPLGAGGMYWILGSPASIDPVATQQVHDNQLAEMVEKLAARMKANPADPAGWAMLARSYKAMGRMGEAEQAFVNAGELLNTDPELMVQYADLLAARNNNNIEGKPLELVNKALSLNPQHPMGLMISAVAAYRRSEFNMAVAQWEKLLPLLDPASEDAQQIQADIADARAKAGMPAASTAPSDAGKLPPVSPQAAAAMTPEMITQMVDRLAARMKTEPGNLAGWAQLARAYKTQGRLPEAEEAYAKAGKLVETDPELLTQYADVLAMRTNNIEGRPLALVNKALALDPKHPVALMMAGSAAYRRAEYAKAVGYWETALTALPAGSPDANMVMTEIADARTKGGLSPQLKAKP